MIQVQLIGATQVRAGARVLEGRDFGGVKPRQLLELLALQVGVPVSKERLADLLWGGEPPASYVATLEGYVSQLRARLQPGVPARSSAIRTVHGGYLLDAEQARVDLGRVHELVADARAARSGAALPLLQQALDLAGAELLVSSPSAGWADAARQCLLRVLVDAGTLAATQALRLGQHELAVELADRVLARDPMAEEACRCAMRALWACGLSAEALRRHGDLRRVLADELGVDPAPATQALMAQLLRDEAPPAVPLQRRCTDPAPAPAGRPARQVDVLAGAVVLALRRGSGADAEDDEDPRLVEMLQGVLRHLQAESAPQAAGAAA